MIVRICLYGSHCIRLSWGPLGGYSTDEMTAQGFRAMSSALLNESGKWHPDASARWLVATVTSYHHGADWQQRMAMAQWWSDCLDQLQA